MSCMVASTVYLSAHRPSERHVLNTTKRRLLRHSPMLFSSRLPLEDSSKMPVCPECGTLFSEKTDGQDWYDILATLSDRIPGRDHCESWLSSKGISDEDAEQTATSMLASLRYDIKKGVWKRGKTEYVDIWATFRSWCLRGQRQNGTGPHYRGPALPGMKVKKGYY